MENGLTTIQKYYRIQRIAAVFFFLMVVVSLLLPYSKVDTSSLYVPVVYANSTTYGYQLGLAIIAVILALICTLLVILTKNRILSIIAFFIAVLIAIMLLFLPEEIRFNRIFIKPPNADYKYGVGFYLIIIGGICLIIISFLNMILVAQNAPKERLFNSDLLDDL
ncbi:MAG: hypothetical protein A3D31_00510 [Candidatus Fluviicola riflensis]|nr:MAG: hypothetical protein CHH17_05035 [Candidatus Fluviicola riflensis]OGS76089.1 MAG: hypothetical protein A3D31_00510 [Candidatus Fluviicola riflensis]OGS81989.1 MAG: hypothetical protein A2724_16265 [Fluviicola sp. RIFCSPHIGHO2_01_FULL_43_53]OGS83427.1 MAG: hypothetical protein A3E30_19430 [Fluviicola sp. RIFCSPHIGHO2_12_FULL_43_24]